MTWNEFYDLVRAQCSCDAHADNIVGNLMDDTQSWNWDAQVPDDALAVLR